MGSIYKSLQEVGGIPASRRSTIRPTGQSLNRSGVKHEQTMERCSLLSVTMIVECCFLRTIQLSLCASCTTLLPQ
jgi:hypothetical protein